MYNMKVDLIRVIKQTLGMKRNVLKFFLRKKGVQNLKENKKSNILNYIFMYSSIISKGKNKR